MSSTQARFIFSDPDGRFRRLCHVLPARFCCALDLTGTWVHSEERRS